MLLRQVIGSVLRRLRLERGITLRELALLARVSVPYLSEVERGRKEPSSEIVAAICRALGIDLADLLDEAAAELARMRPGVPLTSRSAIVVRSRGPAVSAGRRPQIGAQTRASCALAA